MSTPVSITYINDPLSSIFFFSLVALPPLSVVVYTFFNYLLCRLFFYFFRFDLTFLLYVLPLQLPVNKTKKKLTRVNMQGGRSCTVEN